MAPTVDSLRQALAALGIETRGHKDVLAKRLRNANARLTTPPPSSPPQEPAARPRPQGEDYDSFLVFDVEATCENMEGPLQRLSFHYPNEIIEFPVVLLQWRKRSTNAEEKAEEAEAGEWTLEVVDEFQSFVRPTWGPILSAFCTELTGITQDQVDQAPTYPELLTIFRQKFIKKHQLFTRSNRTVWVTDGPWDLRDFIAKASYLSNTPRPPWLAGTIIDLRRMTVEYFALQGAEAVAPSSPPRESSPIPTPSTTSSTPSAPPAPAPAPAPPPPPPPPPPSLSISSVLSSLSLAPFIGREHSGLHDARNISRILVELSRRGMRLKGNREIPDPSRGGREQRWNWMSGGKVGGAKGKPRVEWEREKERELRRVKGEKGGREDKREEGEEKE